MKRSCLSAIVDRKGCPRDALRSALVLGAALLSFPACVADDPEESQQRFGVSMLELCEEQNGRVTMCHVPPGNPSAAHTIRVGLNAVQTHLDRHDGDRCGSCNDEGAACQACAEHDCEGDVFLSGSFVSCLDACPDQCGPDCPTPPELSCADAEVALFVSPGGTGAVTTAELEPQVTVSGGCPEGGPVDLTFDEAGTTTTHSLTCDDAGTSITLYATDGDGNQTSCEIPVIDRKSPTPTCINGLAVELLPPGTNTVFASDFIASPTADCSEPVTYSIDRLVNGTGNPDDTSITLTCSDLALVGGQLVANTVLVEVWGWDAAGNADYCETYIQVADSNGVCGN